MYTASVMTSVGCNLSTDASTSFPPDDDRFYRASYMEAAFGIIAILGMVGNGLVLFVIYKVPNLQKVTNILIGHQSVTDFMASFTLLFRYSAMNIYLAPLVPHHRFLATLICKLWLGGFVFWSCLRVSTANLVFLTLERYVAVVHPQTYRLRASKRVVVTVCVASWTLGILTVVYIPIVYNVLQSRDKVSCYARVHTVAGKFAIAFISFTSMIIVPLAIMLFSYISIICKLRSANRALLEDFETSAESVSLFSTRSVHLNAYGATIYTSCPPTSEEQERRMTEQTAQRDVLKTMFIVCIVYLVCWIPNQVLYFHHQVIRSHDWSKAGHQFVILLAVTNVCINPLIYALKYRSFQIGLKQVFS